MRSQQIIERQVELSTADKEVAERRKAMLILKSKEGHKPGTKHVLADGSVYIVRPDGAWKRISQKRFHNREKYWFLRQD